MFHTLLLEEEELCKEIIEKKINNNFELITKKKMFRTLSQLEEENGICRKIIKKSNITNIRA